MRIAVYGAGAMGTILGAYISRAGVPVDLISRNEGHVAALNARGAHIVGTVDFVQPVRALLPSQMQGEYDLIFLMTKQRENAQIAAFLRGYLRADGAVCTCQNGLPEPGLAAVLGADRVLGCAVAWGATFVGDGVSRLTSDPSALTFSLGAYGKSGRLADAQAALGCMGAVTVCDNFIGARWSKLLINSAFSGLSAATGQTFGAIAGNKASRRVAQRIMKECIDVAKASGVRVEPVQGHRIDRLLDYKGPLKRALSFRLIPVAMKKHAGLVSGMLRDLQNGRRCEIDFICGAVCRSAGACGVPAPFNARTVEIVHGIEEGKYAVSPSNIALYADLFGGKRKQS